MAWGARLGSGTRTEGAECHEVLGLRKEEEGLSKRRGVQ